MLKAGVAVGALGLAPRDGGGPGKLCAPPPKGWRSYVLTARIEPTDGAIRAWIPLPTFEAADWQRPGNVTWTGNAKVAERVARWQIRRRDVARRMGGRPAIAR